MLPIIRTLVTPPANFLIAHPVTFLQHVTPRKLEDSLILSKWVATDVALFAERLALLPDAPVVGDFVHFSDGSFKRIAESWGKDHFQTASADGRYHLGEFGNRSFVSHSGGCDEVILKSKLKPTNGTKRGWAWIEHLGILQAGCGIDGECLFRVWSYEL